MTRGLRLGEWWRRRRWARSAQLTRSEIVVVKALLPKSDRRSAMLLTQATDAPFAERRLLDPCTYELTIPFVKAEVDLVDIKRDVVSPKIVVRDTQTGRMLAFYVRVLRGGFLGSVLGTAEDGGAWPLEWDVDANDVFAERDRQCGNWLPEVVSVETRQNILLALAQWCGMCPREGLLEREQLVDVGEPVSESEIACCEARLGVVLPDEYREFVSICDGLSVRRGRSYDVFGVSDAFVVDMEGRTYLVVTSLYEDGVVGMELGSGESDSTVLLSRTAKKPEPIGNLKVHVRDSLRWLAQIVMEK